MPVYCLFVLVFEIVALQNCSSLSATLLRMLFSLVQTQGNVGKWKKKEGETVRI